MSAAKLPEREALRDALAAYDRVVERQGVERLPELDRWYREELPACIAGRAPAYLTRSEMARLTEWKMARGVWRARNLALVRGNDPAVVEATSRAAFSTIPDPNKPITELSKLSGVGPATASAALAAVAPGVYPFFDELVAAQIPGLAEVSWTAGFYRRYAEALRSAAHELGDDWTPALLERALWAYVGGKAAAAPLDRRA